MTAIERPHASAIQTAGPQNRVIWMLWMQGFDKAAPLVSACVDSWVTKNPGWDVVLLSRDNLKDHVDPAFLDEIAALDLPIQKTANLIRLYLLAHKGGVWADASCYCARPLDTWLPDAFGAGFFAFRFSADAWLARTADDKVARLLGRSDSRIMSNWFLASDAGNPIAVSFLELHLAWFRKYRFVRRSPRRIFRPILKRVLVRNAWLASRMSTDVIARTMQGFPYHIFHFHFAAMLLAKPDLHALWRSARSLPSEPCLAYSKSMHLASDPVFEAALSGQAAPVYKLHWDRTRGEADPASRIAFVLSRHGSVDRRTAR